MKYNEKIMNSSIMGDDDALDELKFNAGSGDCEAQYYLAMYYANICGHLHDPDYHYWIEKSKEMDLCQVLVNHTIMMMEVDFVFQW